MKFADQEITIATGLGEIAVCVSGSALHVIWGEGTGPQTAKGLIQENLEALKIIAAQKFEAGELNDNGAVVITDLDIED